MMSANPARAVMLRILPALESLVAHIVFVDCSTVGPAASALLA